MPALFAATIFVSAMLLFMVQPMVGKRILPLLGGSPAAWNTCMVFFQMLLLLGYLYSHAVTSRLAARPQTRLHRAVLGTALVWLLGMSVLAPDHSPVAVFPSLAPTGESYPIFGVLMLLTVSIGLPFLVVSTSAPLLQKWFTFTGHESAKDPYFLYAASNAGSLISLLAYPILIEPQLTLIQQAWLWTGGFALLFVLVALCAAAANNPLRPPPARPNAAPPSTGPSPSGFDRLRWVGYAFVPSSLMLGVTFHMTTDIASVPLLWVIPLALYLLTFIIAFAKLPEWFRPLIGNLSPVLSLLLVFVLISGAMNKFPFYSLVIHLVVYFFTALLMHSELARARPNPKYLTEYFLWISVGGVLGGIFNALVAPMVFTSDFEYPIAIALGCMLVPVLIAPTKPPTLTARRLGFALDVLVPALMVALICGIFAVAARASWFAPALTWTADSVTAVANRLGVRYVMTRETLTLLPLYALPCMACFFFIDRPLRFGLCVAAVLGTNLYRNHQGEQAVPGVRKGVEHSVRSYFGIMKVESYDEAYRPFYFPWSDPAEPVGADGTPDVYLYMHKQPFRKLLHGTTLHGVQAVGSWTVPVRDDLQALAAANPWAALAVAGMQKSFDFSQEPLTYYHRTGPVGAIVHRFRELDPLGPIGMVGLGTGSVSCYALPGQKLTYYEIDRHVVDMMEKGDEFTYVNDAKKRGAVVNIVLGDARLQLEPTADRYGLLLIDAFSSDSIPIHLITKQAVELYKSRLTEHGLLALHISNRYIDLEPVVARLAEATGLKCRLFSDNDEDYSGKTRSSWVLLAKTDADLGDAVTGTAGDERYGAVAGPMGYHIFDNAQAGVFKFPWREMPVVPEVKVWTDDYSDVLCVIRMDEIRWLRRKFGLPVPKERGE